MHWWLEHLGATRVVAGTLRCTDLRQRGQLEPARESVQPARLLSGSGATYLLHSMGGPSADRALTARMTAISGGRQLLAQLLQLP
jgi:hypothetical protein